MYNIHQTNGKLSMCYGHSPQVAIVGYKKGSLEVKSHSWDANLGGRDFDQVLFEHFADEFQAKHKRDVRTNPKGTFRLLANAEKVRQLGFSSHLALLQRA